MQATEFECPNCGASLPLSDQAAAVCPYCGSHISSTPKKSAEATEEMDLGFKFLGAGEYNVAEVYFTQVVNHHPAHQEAWFCKAVAAALKPDGDLGEAAVFYQTSTFTPERAAAYLARLAKSYPQLFKDSLAFLKDTGEDQTGLKDLFLRMVLDSDDLPQIEEFAQWFTDMADQTWMDGDVDLAVEFMQRALAIDPNIRPTNLLVLEAAGKKLD